MADLMAMLQSSGGEAKTFGRLYAESYIAASGGSIIEVATTDDLETEINNSSDNDALLLEPGSYAYDALTRGSFYSDPFRGKNILIVGDTNEAQEVLVEVNHDGEAAARDHPIFTDNTGPTIYRQLAFLAFKRLAITGTNYADALVRGNDTEVRSPRGVMVNCYFDNNNFDLRADISWHYDNNNRTTIDVRFIRCTFAYYQDWQASYSGLDNVLDVGNCLFDKTTDTTEYVNLGGNVVNAVIDTTNRTYDTATYPTAGHLYVPNTDVID